jgi:hypothetical protein
VHCDPREPGRDLNVCVIHMTRAFFRPGFKQRTFFAAVLKIDNSKIGTKAKGTKKNKLK